MNSGKVKQFLTHVLLLTGPVLLMQTDVAEAIQSAGDIPPNEWGVEGAREDMLETAHRWNADDGTPMPASAISTTGPEVPAFPGAQGFGANAFGGRGGELYRVTNLNDSGPGSLREAAEAHGPRIIIFDISGTIELEEPIEVTHPYMTIAGQTAPGEGVTVANHRFDVRTYDVIIRHMTFRHGSDGSYHNDDWTLRIRFGTHIILDHVTVSWGVDGNLGVTEMDQATVQNSFIAKPLWNAEHPKGERGYGTLVRGSEGAQYSFIGNLWTNHRSRMPRPGNYTSHDEDPEGLLMDFRNNVIYQGQGYNHDDDTVTKYNFINNYFLTDYEFEDTSDYTEGFLDGNILVGSKPEDQWGALMNISFFRDRQDHEVFEPFETGQVTTLSAEEALEFAFEHAGAPRDQHDRYAIQEAKNYYLTEIEGQEEEYDLPQWWTKDDIDHQDEVGGLPEVESKTIPKWIDSNRNGIPDWWEQQHGLDSSNPGIANEDRNGDGYTNIEEYINDMEAIEKTHELIENTTVVQAESAADQMGFDDYFEVREDEDLDISYIEATEDAPDQDEAPDDGILEYHTDLEGEGNIWLLVNMPDASSDSFFLNFSDHLAMEPWSFDYEDHDQGYGHWAWVKYQEAMQFDADGDNNLYLTRRESGAKIDRIMFTTDADFEPVNPNQEFIEIKNEIVQAEDAQYQDGFDDYFRTVDVEENGEEFTYIEAIEDAPEREEAPEDGILEYNTTIEGELDIWVLVNMADSDSDSFYLGFGDNPMYRWWFNYEDHEEDYGSWVWAKYEDVTDRIDEPFVGDGNTNLYLTRREAGAKLDRILFSNDPDYVPEDPDREELVSAGGDDMADVPAETELKQNYPNPFNPVTTIEYSLASDEQVTVEVFNALGQHVKTLVDHRQTAGTHTVRFDGADLSSGMYIYRLRTDEIVETRKMMLIK